MSTLTAHLVNPVVLSHGRTQVRVQGKGIGRVRVGDVRFWTFGAFDRVVSVEVAPRIDVKLGFARVTLTPTIVPGVAPPHAPAVVANATPTVMLDIPQPQFNVAVRLYEYEPASPSTAQLDLQRDRVDRGEP
jgi:hypothetical protein